MPGALFFIAAGVAVLGIGAIYALHHLRIRPNRVTAPTLLFWQQAVRPQQTKTLWHRRLSHRHTFALLSAIALLASLGMIADRFGQRDDRGTDVIVIDSGAAMNARTDDGRTLLAGALDQAIADVPTFGQTPAVISAGPIPLLLSPADQPAAIVRRELSSLAPRPGASAARLAIQMAAGLQGQRCGRILWYTAEPTLPEGLPQEIAQRIERRTTAAASRAAITAVAPQLTPSDSGRNVLRVTAAGATQGTLTLTARGENGITIEQPLSLQNGRAETTLALPAGAGDVSLALRGNADTAPAEAVTFKLHDPTPPTFRFVGPVPAALRAALLAFGTESPTGTIVVLNEGTPRPTGVRAAIVIQPATTAAGNEPLALTAASFQDAPLQNGDWLERARVQSVAAALPGTPLLTAGRWPAVGLERQADGATLCLSDSLVNDQADLPRRAAFPVLMQRWCDQLVGRQTATVSIPWQRSAEDPLWAGPGDVAVRQTIAVADTPAAPPNESAALATPGDIRWQMPWAEIVLGGALVLAVVEGLLFAARKII